MTACRCERDPEIENRGWELGVNWGRVAVRTLGCGEAKPLSV